MYLLVCDGLIIKQGGAGRYRTGTGLVGCVATRCAAAAAAVAAATAAVDSPPLANCLRDRASGLAAASVALLLLLLLPLLLQVQLVR